MDLIALKDFRNVQHLRLKEEDKDGKVTSTVDGSIHDDHIHKGARFSIGTGKTLKDVQKQDAALAQAIASLSVAGCVGDANDKELCRLVAEEIALDKNRAEHAKKLNAAASDSALVQQLVAALKGGGIAAPAK